MIVACTERGEAGAHRGAVLLVDDDPSVRTGLARLLEFEGLVVSTAASLWEAESLLERAHFDLVITDLRLEGTDGCQGLEVVSRARRCVPDVVTVLFTAFGDEQVREAALRRGAVDLWEKSMPISELIGRLRRLRPGRGRRPPDDR